MRMIVENVVNLVANAVLIYGDSALTAIGLPAIDLPALGTFGCGLSTNIATVAAAVTLAIAIRKTPAPAERGATVPARAGADRAVAWNIVKLGAPIGLHLIGETGVFFVTGVLAGRMSEDAAGAHQLTFTLATLTFMMSVGLASA